MKTKHLLPIILAFISIFAFAEDIIVLNDGTIIKAIVSDINSSEILYKKFSNPKGPTYHINKTDVLSINYDNGEKENFSHEPSKSSDHISIADNNQSLINHYNNATLSFPKTKLGRKTAYAIGHYKIEEESVLSTDDIEVSFLNRNGFHPTILNKSDKYIYVDLSSSYYSVNGGQMLPFFTSDVISTQSASTSGGNVGLVFGLLSLNGGSYDTNYEGKSSMMERCFPIPSKISLPLPGRKYSAQGNIKSYCPLAEVFIKHDYLKNVLQLREWQILDYTNASNSPVFDATIIIAYSHDRDFKDLKSVTIKLKLSKLIGIPALGGSAELRNGIYNQDGLILTRVLGDFF